MPDAAINHLDFDNDAALDVIFDDRAVQTDAGQIEWWDIDAIFGGSAGPLRTRGPIDRAARRDRFGFGGRHRRGTPGRGTVPHRGADRFDLGGRKRKRETGQKKPPHSDHSEQSEGEAVSRSRSADRHVWLHQGLKPA